jgi:D-aspartate ligase
MVQGRGQFFRNLEVCMTAVSGAIVINGDCGALGIVRSLGRHGIPVWFLKGKSRPLTASSRYTRRSLAWSPSDEIGQRDYLLALAERHGLDGWALFPDGDNVSAMIAKHHATLQGRFRLTTPPWDVLRWAYDKRLTYRLAEEIGVDCPWTRYPSSREAVAALECRFPVILKPAIKVSDNALTANKAWRIDDRRELLARFAEASTLVPPEVIMVQELVPGGGESQFSYAALCREGRPLASLVARRARQHPHDFGRASTYVETVDRPEIEEPARKLLAAMRYTGIVEVEFKHDRRDGRYKLLDINARVWTWHALGRRAGIDFPYLLWRMVHGMPVPELRGRTGVRWIHAVPDIRGAVSAFRRDSFEAGAYLRSFRGPITGAVFALDDPVPAMVEIPMLYRERRKRLRA